MPEEVARYKFIHFDKMSMEWNGKAFYACNANNGKVPLGNVGWYKPWRKWCYLPFEDTVLSDECLEDIQDFITGLECNWRER